MRSIFLLWTIFYSFTALFAQISTDSIQQIDEVIIESQRMALPFQNQSHTISIISANEIAQMPVATLDELLQLVSGIDIRRRGIKGMQSDLYIRGGNFNQVLVLIDGIAMNDLQTGHHIMNGIISLDNIKRIEVVKGAAARIYGQNAMNGAINILTKNVFENKTKASLSAGSYESLGASVQTQQKFDDFNLQISVDKQQSDGYRYNTDFDNWNAFLKVNWIDYSLLFSYAQRDFGANGFYASPDFKDQYEETQTHLIAIKRKFNRDNSSYNLKTYWRRNEDMYLFLRHDPDFYRNLHINNIVGFGTDANFKSPLGNTGVGIDVSQGFIESNNLGDRERFSAIAFVEHRFQLLSKKLDITPGVAISYFSDFKSFANPGLDVGYRFSDTFKIYGNLGYTNRIPTYTNLYYTSPAEEGNANLAPEKAFTYEGGFYFTPEKWQINLAIFNRNTTNLIDWTKESEADKWRAQNIGEFVTKGIEAHGNYTVRMTNYPQKISFGYTYLDEEIKKIGVSFSRYSLNSFRHQFSGQLTSQFLPFLQQHISYRLNERTDGTNYQIVDIGFVLNYKEWGLKINANNIFSETYTETNLVPMPADNYSATLDYRF